MGKIIKKVLSKKKDEVLVKNKKNKYEFKFVENLIFGGCKSGEFEQMLDEVASIVYSHICQLTKNYQVDSNSLNSNLLKGASFNG